MSYQVGREPGIGPARLTCPKTDTDHSDQSVPVLFAPLFLEGLHAEVLLMGWERAGRAVRAGDLADGPGPPLWPAGQPVAVPISRRTVRAAPAPASTAA
jgi:hypothetical protein